MQGAILCWSLNILLALIIFYTAELGHLIGLKGQPLAISVAWPPTGFSLAALLLFGFKIWPGIFLGNFAYNFFNIYLNSHALISPLATAIVISTGSLLQALLSASIIRRCSSKGYFNTVKDVFIFLIPAGLLSCLIASSIGVVALYFYQEFSGQTAFNIWITFWLGDVMGVYIFTPLLIIWTLYKTPITFSKYNLEAVGMFFSFFVLNLLTIFWSYPLAQLYLPLSIWVSYRFRMHGATLAIFLIALVTIIPTSMGYGTFIAALVSNQLIILISYLGIIVGTCLMLTAVINEREAAWHLIQIHNIDLQQAVDIYLRELREVHGNLSLKERFTLSLGLMMSGIARQIRVPLKKIDNFSKAGIALLDKIRDAISAQREKDDSKTEDALQGNIENLQSYLENISKYQGFANRITKIMQEQLAITYADRIKVKAVNINTILNTCLIQATVEEARRHPDFTFTLTKTFDKAIKTILVLPEDLAHAFIHFFVHSFYSMREKKNKLGAAYSAVLEVRTIEFEDKIEIIIRDDGIGIQEEQVKLFFQSFLDAEPAEEATGLNNALAHDIIVHVHQGGIKVRSKLGEYLQFTLTLPKRQNAEVQLLRSAMVQASGNRVRANL